MRTLLVLAVAVVVAVFLALLLPEGERTKGKTQ
jgi:hypothetical protein